MGVFTIHGALKVPYGLGSFFRFTAGICWHHLLTTESTWRGVKFLELCKDHQWEKVKKILTEQPNLINCESWSHVYMGITTFFYF